MRFEILPADPLWRLHLRLCHPYLLPELQGWGRRQRRGRRRRTPLSLTLTCRHLTYLSPIFWRIFHFLGCFAASNRAWVSKGLTVLEREPLEIELSSAKAYYTAEFLLARACQLTWLSNECQQKRPANGLQREPSLYPLCLSRSLPLSFRGHGGHRQLWKREPANR